MNSWFRSWHGAPTDPKWLLIAKRAGVTPGMVSSVFWALLDYASQESDRGSVRGFDTESYAAWAGYDHEQVEDIIAEMMSKGVISNLRLAAWEERQPAREDSSTERTRQYRKRKNESNGSNGDVTQCDAEERSVTHQSRVEESRVVAVATTAQEPLPPLPLAVPEEEKRLTPEVFRQWVKEYERTQGLLISSPYEGDKVHYWGHHVPFESWSYALQQAQDNRQKGRWSYIETILKRVEKDGLPAKEQVKAAATPKEIKGNLGALLQ